MDLLQDELLLLKTGTVAQPHYDIVYPCCIWSLICVVIEMAEMDVQKEELSKLEKELSKEEAVLEQEKTKSKGMCKH